MLADEVKEGYAEERVLELQSCEINDVEKNISAIVERIRAITLQGDE